MTSAEVGDEAVRLVEHHAARPGMDSFVAAQVVRVIRAIPVDEEASIARPR